MGDGRAGPRARDLIGVSLKLNCALVAPFQILPGVRVIIVNPETRGPLGDSHLGEVSVFKGE